MKQELESVVAAAVRELFALDVAVELTRPEEQHGDYATNVALQLAGKLASSTPGGPREVAEALAARVKGLSSHIQEVVVAGPGFLNLKLTDEALVTLASQKPAKSLAGQTIVAEYSDPNPFKVLHAGHLYTTLVGNAIASLFAVAGAQVHRVNFGGDVGLHVGKTMWAILKTLGGEHPEKLQEVDENGRLEWLSAHYVQGNNAYEDDEQAKQAIIELNKRVYQLHAENDHDSPFAVVYWTCRQWSYDGFDRLYRQLQVQPFEKYYPESVTIPEGTRLVREGLERGVFVESDGAVVFRGEEHGLHTRVFLNSQGIPTYEAKDLGLASLKWVDYTFDKSLIVTANEQAQYMQVVMQALTNFYPEATARTVHLTHGIIKLAGGVKMSSRKGNILRAEEVLEAAAQANRQATGQDNYQAVLGAVKYAFLKQRIGADIVYDPLESVSILGNTGPYLQYAHARARSILSKAPNFVIPGGAEESDASQPEPIHFGRDDALEAEERTLVRKMGGYAEAVDKAVAELMPHHICTYLYELAQTFNRFYEHNRVLGDAREAVRLQLLQAYADTLKNGLELLGIAAPNRM